MVNHVKEEIVGRVVMEAANVVVVVVAMAKIAKNVTNVDLRDILKETARNSIKVVVVAEIRQREIKRRRVFLVSYNLRSQKEVNFKLSISLLISKR